ncbi:hypothetical protein [Dactylosporangium matsuzakiense]|uniref:Uncharacterized protein n=1 Tax=Dactylosporangium matsuzakiense TaxID=53360 RepID=A0A9W6NPV6_9ACTN|nr:hypothetical protein [Dactylosporangium matsuzakiense]UWZ44685.1 hypothetical protein Dmats_46415 [Dactylosporangium matsuzakiense]GLL04708.1 hypothetical protein GCM10017581_064550 [Dactylosporangium matsuzakiense]
MLPMAALMALVLPGRAAFVVVGVVALAFVVLLVVRATATAERRTIAAAEPAPVVRDLRYRGQRRAG